MAVRMLVFFLIVTVIVVGLHTYVGWRVLAALRPRSRLRPAIRVGLALSCVAIVLAFGVGRLFEPGWASRALNWVGFGALGTIAIFFGLYVGRDGLLAARGLLRLGRRVAKTPVVSRADGPTRRDVLAGASHWTVLGVGGALTAGSFVQAHRAPVVEDVRIPIPDLPSDLEGFTIAQISDLHLGPTLGHAFAAEVAEQVNALEADLVAVTGDLVDGRVDDLAAAVAPLGALRGRYGVHFVTGNHEYYWNAPSWTAHLRTLGWTVLENEHRRLEVGGARLAVGGVTDLSAASFDERERSDPVRAFRGAEDVHVRLLLAHQPKSLYGAQDAGVHLQLSGHTHAGQVFPMSLLVYLAHPIVRGLGRFGDTWVYVNRGTAYWGPPMRSGRPGEITRVVLARATS